MPSHCFRPIALQFSCAKSSRTEPLVTKPFMTNLVHFELALGSSCDRVSSAGGTCHALRDGESALVQCLVHSRSEAPGVYDVELRLEHTSLPTLAITGSMSDAMNTSVTLQATATDRVKIEAECVATTTVIQPGVVGFRLAACTASLDGMASPACDIELDAGFENCAR